MNPRGAESQFDAGLVRLGHVYLCDEQVALADLCGYHDCGWGDAVVSVAVSDLDPALLQADEEYWRGQEHAGEPLYGSCAGLLEAFPHMDEPAFVYATLVDGGTVSYQGLIKAAWLRVELVLPRPDLPLLQDLRSELRASPWWGQGLSGTAALEQLQRRYRLDLAAF